MSELIIPVQQNIGINNINDYLDEATMIDDHLNMNNKRIYNIAEPIDDQDAVRKIDLETKTYSLQSANIIDNLDWSRINNKPETYASKNSTHIADGNLVMGNYKIITTATNFEDDELITKKYYRDNLPEAGIKSKTHYVNTVEELTAAMTNAVTGDVITIAPGMYTINGTNTFSTSGVTFCSAWRGQVKTTSISLGNFSTSGTASGLQFEGLNIHGTLFTVGANGIQYFRDCVFAPPVVINGALNNIVAFYNCTFIQDVTIENTITGTSWIEFHECDFGNNEIVNNLEAPNTARIELYRCRRISNLESLGYNVNLYDYNGGTTTSIVKAAKMKITDTTISESNQVVHKEYVDNKVWETANYADYSVTDDKILQIRSNKIISTDGDDNSIALYNLGAYTNNKLIANCYIKNVWDAVNEMDAVNLKTLKNPPNNSVFNITGDDFEINLPRGGKIRKSNRVAFSGIDLQLGDPDTGKLGHVTRLATPEENDHAVNKLYVDMNTLNTQNDVYLPSTSGYKMKIAAGKGWSNGALTLGITWTDPNNPSNQSSFGVDNIGRMAVHETNGVLCAFISGNNIINTLSTSGLSNPCDIELKDSIRNKTELYIESVEEPVKNYWNKITKQLPIYTYVYKDKDGNPTEEIYQSCMWQDAYKLFNNILQIPQKVGGVYDESYFDNSDESKMKMISHQQWVYYIILALQEMNKFILEPLQAKKTELENRVTELEGTVAALIDRLNRAGIPE